jgi:hypothetical protein
MLSICEELNVSWGGTILKREGKRVRKVKSLPNASAHITYAPQRTPA